MTALASGDHIRQPVECVITVNDAPITNFYPYLREVRVKHSRSAAATCTLVFDSIRTETGEWLIEDADVFLPWRSIRIEARFGDRTQEVLRGVIRQVRSEHPPDMSASTVTVEGQDESLTLDREHVRRVWSTAAEPKSDGDIASEIAQAHGLAADTEAGLTNRNLGQDGTAVKLLQARAEANGFEFFVRAGTLHFRPPRLDGDPQPTIMVYAGLATNCLRFTTTFDGHRPDEVRVLRAAETGTGDDDVTVTPDLPLLGTDPVTSEGAGDAFVWVLQQPAGATPDEVSARAQAAANRNAWKLTAEGELDGVLYGHVLLSHEVVVVDGVGETYGGRYYVDEVEHKFSMDGYRQTFKLLRNALGAEPVAAGGGASTVL